MREMGEAELIRRAVEGRLLDVRTSIAATVVSFDADTKRAIVRPGVRFQVVDPDSPPEVDTLDDVEVDVLFPHFGPFVLYHPLSQGDVGRLEWSEEDDAEVYATGDATPLNPQILDRHGAHAVFRPEGSRAGDLLGEESTEHGYIGEPGGIGIQFLDAELRLGGSDATDPVALSSKVNSETSSNKADLTTLKAAITAALTSLDGAIVALGGTSTSAGTFTTTTGAVPHTPASVAASEVKAK